MIILSGDCTPFHLKYPKSYDACQQTNSMKKKKKKITERPKKIRQRSLIKFLKDRKDECSWVTLPAHTLNLNYMELKNI